MIIIIMIMITLDNFDHKFISLKVMSVEEHASVRRREALAAEAAEVIIIIIIVGVIIVINIVIIIVIIIFIIIVIIINIMIRRGPVGPKPGGKKRS